MRIVALVSGSGTTLQAVLDALTDGRIPAQVVAVGADKPCQGLERAAQAGAQTFVVEPAAYPNRSAWNRGLQAAVAEHQPDLVLLAGFMRILDAEFVAAFAPDLINTHPALLPSFPGAHGVRDALAHGVKVTGATVHRVVPEVDAGEILAQVAVPVLSDDDESSLHERIKMAERELYVETVSKLVAAVN
ncbi:MULTISPECIES: phosphoribosylglycinamide formyltransferase [Kocuria]|uniref:Phosphoribosylglycinamide formyltransferase n=1 Tax=Kocuria subflava TaxID=1736139 RepID=A0A846TIR2_9MICC|nr:MULTISPECIES: phosphoribosylglycinamide formyltransferase [Kocuria]NKE09048.1 phosphoribosylglycinamide formyltransferase [Kocuria subflava]